MRRGWPLLALTLLAAGGCGQKGPLYLPDKNAKVITTAPPATTASPATAAPAADTAQPAATPAAPKRDDKDKDQGSQPPK